MKKNILLILFFITTTLSFSQVLNQPANWPDANWTVSGTFQAGGLLNNPTTDDAFTFSDDAAGSGSVDNIIAESPIIDLTAAFNAGETQLFFSGNYNHRDIGGTLTLDYFNADTATWIPMFDFVGNGAGSEFSTCTNMQAYQAGVVINGFTATQLSGFKYRFAYDDAGGWQWGFCIKDSAVISGMAMAPNCDAVVSTPADGATNVAVDAQITWSAASGSPEGYFVSIGTTAGGTDVLNNFDVGNVLTYDPTGVIDFSTVYFITITPYNGVGSATGCTSSTFSTVTNPNTTVICANGPVSTTFCYTNNDTTTFNYTSDDGSPLVVVFNSGSTENNFDELIVLDSDGTTNLNAGTPYGAGGNLTGLVFTSTGNSISVGVTSDGSVISCTNDPWNFEVSCIDTTALPNCNATLTTPTNGAINVGENTDLTWSPATIFVTGYLVNMGTTPGGIDVANAVDVGNVLTYEPGTLQSSQIYYVTIVPYNDNGNATGCTEESFTVRTIPTPPNGVTCASGSSSFVFTEDFEANPALGWTGTTFSGGNGDWDITGNANSGGTGPSASFNGGMHLEYEASGNSTTIASAISPAIDLTSAVDAAELSFYMHAFGDDIGTLNVNVSNSATGPFTNIFSWGGQYQTSDTEAWLPVGLNLDAYLGQIIYLEFSYGGAGTGFEGDLSIDYVRVETCGNFCIAPSNITVTNIGGTSVDISWTPNNGEAQWQYVVQPAGTGEPTAAGTVINATSVTVTGLDYSTDYEVYVLADCNPDLSIWAGPIPFSTTIQTDFTVDCSAAPVNTTYCYVSNDTTQFTYTGSTGFPLNILFNAGQVENNWDEVIILDSDGVTDLNAATPYGNAGDLTGLAYTSTGNTLTVIIQSDGSVSCQTSGYTQWDFDVWCQTCITQTATYNVVGQCEPTQEFSIEVDISDMGDAASITVSDDQGSTDQVVTTTGVVTFGPYVPNIEVIITVANTDDVNCIINSEPLTFLCPPPPNECSIVYAGMDDSVSCDDPTTDLTAIFMPSGIDSNLYEINALNACPTPPTTGGETTGIDIDDRWSDVIDMTFDFCFFGNTYNQIVVGANGLVTFDTSVANGFCPWAFDELVPDPGLPTNSIFGAYHDINPATCGNIEYLILGSAPSRQFVVNFTSICQFSCTTLETSQQIILYEGSSNIDVNIFSKPLCATWNGGNAVIGVQNIDGTIGFTPVDRNTGPWEATDEFYRFSPGGDPNYTFEWLDGDGTTSLGTTETISVSPSVTTTYTAAVSYTQCDGSIKVETDTVVVEFVGEQLTIVQPGNAEACVDNSGGIGVFDLTLQDATVLDGQTGYVVSYHNTEADALANTNAISNPTAYSNTTNPETIYVRVEDDVTGNCNETTSFEINVRAVPYTIETECLNNEFVLTINPDGNSFDVTQASYTLYDDMNNVLQSNVQGDNTFVIDTADFIEPISGATFNYVIEVGDTSGCFITKDLLIQGVSCVFPQGISPNGDGFNDTFDLGNYQVSNIQIFNRNGQMIYSRDNYTNEWDGKSEAGQELPVGTYFYVMRYQGNKERNGWIYINR